MCLSTHTFFYYVEEFLASKRIIIKWHDQVYAMNFAERLTPVCKMLIKLCIVCFEIVCVCLNDILYILLWLNLGLWNLAYMYGCMYVCMYICVYVCMYVCMYMHIYVCMYCVCVCMRVCTYICMYICVYVCMYVCMCVYVCMCISVTWLITKWGGGIKIDLGYKELKFT